MCSLPKFLVSCTAILLVAFTSAQPGLCRDDAAFFRALEYAEEKTKEHRYDLAIGTLEDLKLQAAASELPKIEYFIAVANKDRGDFAKANEAIRACLTHGGSGSAVYFLAGEIEEGLGHVSNAEYYYNLAGRRSSRGSSYFSSAANLRASQLEAAGSDRRVHALGRWDCRRMPLRVYIDDGSKVIGYEPSLRQDAINAFNAWSQASNGSLQFKIMPPGQCEGKDVRKDWTGGMKDPGRDIHLHWLPVLAFKDREPLGVTYPKTITAGGIPVIAYTDIYIATNENATGGTYTAKGTGASKEQIEAHLHQLQYVLLHEIGHGLGLEHSVYRSDIMSAIVFGALASRFSTTPALSTNDKKAMLYLYTGPDASNPYVYDSRTVAFHDEMAQTTVNAYNLAAKQFQAGQYSNAVTSILAALQKTPNNPELHFLLAGCYHKQGRGKNARSELETVLKLSPTPQLAEKARTLLTAMPE